MLTNTLVKLAIFAILPTHAIAQSARTTRYWDCCKPSCAWNGKAQFNAPVRTCARDGVTALASETQDGCNGGNAFSCTNNSPWAVSNDLAYGFAATALSGVPEGDLCCACYTLTFTSGSSAGKKMIVQSISTSPAADNFSILMPGGGVGIFDGCQAQYGSFPGARFGGVASRSECASIPASLRAGCQWRFDWFNNADNPDVMFTRVKCPNAIVAKSGCVRNDDGNFAP